MESEIRSHGILFAIQHQSNDYLSLSSISQSIRQRAKPLTGHLLFWIDSTPGLTSFPEVYPSQFVIVFDSILGRVRSFKKLGNLNFQRIGGVPESSYWQTTDRRTAVNLQATIGPRRPFSNNRATIERFMDRIILYPLFQKHWINGRWDSIKFLNTDAETIE
jgi:hypothetical protein